MPLSSCTCSLLSTGPSLQPIRFLSWWWGGACLDASGWNNAKTLPLWPGDRRPVSVGYSRSKQVYLQKKRDVGQVRKTKLTQSERCDCEDIRTCDRPWCTPTSELSTGSSIINSLLNQWRDFILFHLCHTWPAPVFWLAPVYQIEPCDSLLTPTGEPQRWQSYMRDFILQHDPHRQPVLCQNKTQHKGAL